MKNWDERDEVEARGVLLLCGSRCARELVVGINHLPLNVGENGRMSKVLHGEFSFSLSHSSDLRGIYVR